MQPIKGYKVFDSNLTCNKFQYEIGKVYIHNGNIKLCKQGFHFCLNLSDCFNYYHFDSNNRVCEIEAINVSQETSSDSKKVCGQITILKELSWYEVLDLVNTGKNNSGYRNSGDSNSGDYNSGDRNSGHKNSGNYNSGYYNSGNRNSNDYNSGNYNSGDHNSGDYNSGNYNSGDNNSGDYNSGSRNSGYFNTNAPNVRLFNKESNLSFDEFLLLDLPYIALRLTTYIGNQLITISYKEAWKEFWLSTSKENKNKILNLPNFDAKIFEEITGISV